MIDLMREKKVIASKKPTNAPQGFSLLVSLLCYTTGTLSNSANYRPHQELTLPVPFSSFFSLSLAPFFFLLFTLPSPLSFSLLLSLFFFFSWFPLDLFMIPRLISFRYLLQSLILPLHLFLFLFFPLTPFLSLSVAIPFITFLVPIYPFPSTSIPLPLLLYLLIFFYLPSSLLFILLIFFHPLLTILQIFIHRSFSFFRTLTFLLLFSFVPPFCIA